MGWPDQHAPTVSVHIPMSNGSKPRRASSRRPESQHCYCLESALSETSGMLTTPVLALSGSRHIAPKQISLLFHRSSA